MGGEVSLAPGCPREGSAARRAPGERLPSRLLQARWSSSRAVESSGRRRVTGATYSASAGQFAPYWKHARQGEGFEAAERVVLDLAPQDEAVGEEDRVEQAALGGVVVAGVHQEGVEMRASGAGRGHVVPRIGGGETQRAGRRAGQETSGAGGERGPATEPGGGGTSRRPGQSPAGARQELSRRSTVTRNWLKATPMAEIVMMPAYICGIAKLYWEALIR